MQVLRAARRKVQAVTRKRPDWSSVGHDFDPIVTRSQGLGRSLHLSEGVLGALNKCKATNHGELESIA